MRGYGEEFFYLAIIVFTILSLFVFLSYQRITRGSEVRKTVEERLLNEEIAAMVFTLFNSKVPILEKSYLEIGIDALLQGTYTNKELDKVFYGLEIGSVNVSKVIPSLIDKYVKGRWSLKIITPDGEYTYGKVGIRKVTYSYEVLVPIPEQRVGKIIFLLE